ncbi:unnamed protein product [Ectocarpus sp. CCAP 1310/34]|nr:unnamed protein product [Ectocarpus sp. CCAP 1310/34]
MFERKQRQSDLEKTDGCEGKYTIGLGQNKLAFVDDREDINSVLMTVMQSLLEKYDIDPAKIGRLEVGKEWVGTETLLDKSKSAKTWLMPLLGASNTDVEGVTSYNACYGGSAALFNSVAWVESSEWDGRYALVVCGDIAVYEAGPARPTGGCGAVAMLVGPDAPLVLEPGLRSTHSRDAYDFYKPKHSEYAEVDGRLSQSVYLESVDKCYAGFKAKAAARQDRLAASGVTQSGGVTTPPATVTVDSFDFVSLHAPYNKLVQKGFARMSFLDFRSDPSAEGFRDLPAAAAEGWRTVELGGTYADREIEAAFRKASAGDFKARCLPASTVSREVGNCYTASVFAGLVSVVADKGTALEDGGGARVFMFSYGSGFIATAYSFKARRPTTCRGQFSLGGMQEAMGIKDRLARRLGRTPEDFAQASRPFGGHSFYDVTTAMNLREQTYGKAGYTPSGAADALFPGTFYLTEVRRCVRGKYARENV